MHGFDQLTSCRGVVVCKEYLRVSLMRQRAHMEERWPALCNGVSIYFSNVCWVGSPCLHTAFCAHQECKFMIQIP